MKRQNMFIPGLAGRKKSWKPLVSRWVRRTVRRQIRKELRQQEASQ